MSHIRELMKTEPLETLYQLKTRDGDNWCEPLTIGGINSALLSACEEIKSLEFKLEEASQEIASLQQCDCIERGAE